MRIVVRVVDTPAFYEYVDPGTAQPSGTVGLPERMHEDGTEGPWRPTHLMEKVSRFLESESGVTANKIKKSVKGHESHILEALDYLVEDGYAERRTVGAYAQHFSAKPYREEDLSGSVIAAPYPRPTDGGNVGATTNDATPKNAWRDLARLGATLKTPLRLGKTVLSLTGATLARVPLKPAKSYAKRLARL